MYSLQLVGLDGAHPSSSHIVLWLEVSSCSMRSKTCIVNPGFILKILRFSKLTDASFRARDLASWLLLLRLFHRWPNNVPACLWFDCQTPFGSSVRDLLESSVPSSRHSGRCTLGIEVKLYISCCSPFAVVTKQNDLAAAAYLCVSGVTVQCSSLVRTILRSG